MSESVEVALRRIRRINAYMYKHELWCIKRISHKDDAIRGLVETLLKLEIISDE